MNTLGHETFPLYSFSLPFVSGTHTHKRPCVYKCNLFLERKSAKSMTHVTEARIERVEEIFCLKKTKHNDPLFLLPIDFVFFYIFDLLPLPHFILLFLDYILLHCQ